MTSGRKAGYVNMRRYITEHLGDWKPGDAVRDTKNDRKVRVLGFHMSDHGDWLALIKPLYVVDRLPGMYPGEVEALHFSYLRRP